MATPRAPALQCALTALRHRDLSTHELGVRLRSRGFSESECDGALATLLRTGLLDDERYAEQRARALALRGAGDALIRHHLEAAGIARDAIERALEAAEPEVERAQRIVERRGAGAKTARYLAGKGFSEDAVSRAVAAQGAQGIG